MPRATIIRPLTRRPCRHLVLVRGRAISRLQCLQRTLRLLLRRSRLVSRLRRRQRTLRLLLRCSRLVSRLRRRQRTLRLLLRRSRLVSRLRHRLRCLQQTLRLLPRRSLLTGPRMSRLRCRQQTLRLLPHHSLLTHRRRLRRHGQLCNPQRILVVLRRPFRRRNQLHYRHHGRPRCLHLDRRSLALPEIFIAGQLRVCARAVHPSAIYSPMIQFFTVTARIHA